MTSTPTSATGSRGATTPPGGGSSPGVRVLYALAGALLVFLVVWPLVAGAVVTNEEAIWFHSAKVSSGLWDAIETNWHHRIFRPPDLMGGFLSDENLGTTRIVWLQVPGFLVLLAAVWVACRRLAPGEPAVFPLAASWLMLHTSTPLSVWTLANVSNTWCAAVGAWVGVVLWTAVDRLIAGRPIARQIVWLTLLCAIGVNIKENFYGWPAAGGLVLLCVYLWSLRRRALPLGPVLGAAAGLAVLPLVHLYLRLTTGGLGWTLEQGDERYNLQFGVAFVKNLVLSAMGFLAAAPVHTVRGIDAPLWLKAVPLVGIALAGATALAPWLLVWRRPQSWPERPSGAATALIAIYSYAGMSAAWPSGHVGETYFMGSNAGAAVLVAVGLVGLWRIAGAERVWRWAVGGLAAVSLAIALYGLVARSLHYRHIWYVASTIRAQVSDLQMGMEPSSRPRTIYLKDCESGLSHSRYILRPFRAFNHVVTEFWFNRRHPERPFVFEFGAPPGAEPGSAPLLIDCSTLRPPPQL